MGKSQFASCLRFSVLLSDMEERVLLLLGEYDSQGVPANGLGIDVPLPSLSVASAGVWVALG